MRSISRKDDIVEIYDEKQNLIIFRSLYSLTFFLDSKDGSTDFVISNNDGIVFSEISKLYSNIIETKIDPKHKPKKVEIGDNIEIFCSRQRDNDGNSMTIIKVDDETFKLSFKFDTKGFRSIEIKYDNKNFWNYAPYEMLIMNFFNNVYNSDKGLYRIEPVDSEMALKKKIS